MQPIIHAIYIAILFVITNIATAQNIQQHDYHKFDWFTLKELDKDQRNSIAPYCTGMYVAPTLEVDNNNNNDVNNTDTIYISSNKAQYKQDESILTFEGQVQVIQNNKSAESDLLVLNDITGDIQASGNVVVREQNTKIAGSNATINHIDNTTKMNNALYVLHDKHVRGYAKYIKQKNNIVNLKTGSFTTCEPGNDFWSLHGNTIRINRDTGFASATNVVMRVFDVPVFYLPYIYFGIDSRRISGFLPPSISASRRFGGVLTTPYYVNLAPNYDLTLYPTLVRKGGVLMESEFRHINKYSSTRIEAGFSKDTYKKRIQESHYARNRYFYGLLYNFRLNKLSVSVDYAHTNEPFYFHDMPTRLDYNPDNYLNKRAIIKYNEQNYSLTLQLQGYSITNLTEVTPYSKLPQISVSMHLPKHNQMQIGLNTQYTNFRRNLKTGYYTDQNGIGEGLDSHLWADERIAGVARANAQRYHIEPYLIYPFKSSFGFIQPQLRYYFTHYDFNYDNLHQAQLNHKEYKKYIDIGAVLASVDAGLYFNRRTYFLGEALTHSLNPRIRYQYTSYDDKQSYVPFFDTSEYTFNYASLWRNNRFSGLDRVGDESRISVGVSQSFLDLQGIKKQEINFGFAFYLQDRKVQAYNIDYKKRQPALSNTSPIVGDYVYKFNNNWQFIFDYTYDIDLRTTRNASSYFSYSPAQNKVINIGASYAADHLRYDNSSGKYTYSTDYGEPLTASGEPNLDYIKDYYKIKQTELSFIWPLGKYLHIFGKWQYNHPRKITLDAFVGIEYDNCCAKIRIMHRNWLEEEGVSLNPKINETRDRGIFLQVIFKGLTDVGNPLENILTSKIRGYVDDNK